MMIGYACTSAAHCAADLEAQATLLRAAGADEVLRERRVAGTAREVLPLALSLLRAGDTLVVARLGCAATTPGELDGLLGVLGARRAGLVVLDLDGRRHEANGAAGRLILRALAPLDGIAAPDRLAPPTPAPAPLPSPLPATLAPALSRMARLRLIWRRGGAGGALRSTWQRPR